MNETSQTLSVPNNSTNGELESCEAQNLSLDDISVASPVLETKHEDSKKRVSASRQVLLVPPIRSLTSRGGFQFPSMDSLKGHLTKTQATIAPSLRNSSSTQLRVSIAKLESLLQEAGRLAESVTFDGQINPPTDGTQKKWRVISNGDQKEAESILNKPNSRSESRLHCPVPHGPERKGLTPLGSALANPIVTETVSKGSEDFSWLRDSATPDGHRNVVVDTLTVDGDDILHSPTSVRIPSIRLESSVRHTQAKDSQPMVAPRSSSLRQSRPRTRAQPQVPAVLVNGVSVEKNGCVEETGWTKSALPRTRTGHERHYSAVFGLPSRQVSINLNHLVEHIEHPKIDLRRKSYIDVYNKPSNFDIHQTCNHGPVARNWPDSRKRFTALIACMNTGCIGILLGIYAGEVPAIQYNIADFGHYTILGNVLMYLGMTVSGFVCWPLPLLHGRKPYVLVAQLLALVLQIPQGLAVNGWRDPSQPAYKCLLLVSRAVSGIALGLADMNIKATLLDCFGASLRSRDAELDKLNVYDVRHHGGGMGMWLGFVSWSMVGPISVGFMIGASIVSSEFSVAWGFWISTCIILIVLLINIIMPEVRRSAFRRTVSELTGDAGAFSRVTRGEVKMHLTQTGPY